MTDKTFTMSRRTALRMDESFYVEFEEITGEWGVFGDNSGFCYSTRSLKNDAEEDGRALEFTQN
jgi:hypothetical protein